MAVKDMENHNLLRQSFVHLPGIGPRTEAHLWRSGITNWQQLLTEAPTIFAGLKLEGILKGLDESLMAWSRGDLSYFHKCLPRKQLWRLIDGVFSDIAYFDIEASGGGFFPAAQSTTIAFYFRGEILQEHEYEKKRELIEFILEEAAALCTYNGAAYDIPFLQREFLLPFRKPNFDLCPWLRRQGYKGGLKAIQKAMPHLHQRCSMDINGFDAVRLWQMHQRNVPGALETLLTYNAEDTLILEALLVEAYNREVDQLQLSGVNHLSARENPPLLTQVHPQVYAKLRINTIFSNND